MDKHQAEHLPTVTDLLRARVGFSVRSTRQVSPMADDTN